jgi:Arc/MetJ family transcription regulator
VPRHKPRGVDYKVLCLSPVSPASDAFASAAANLIRTPYLQNMVYAEGMGRTNIVIDEELVKKARKLTRLKTKREIVDKALELLVRSESRKGILKHYGSGIWKGDLKAMRRNRG